MDLYIKITSGARSGDLFKLQHAVTLGRSKADINLKDSKASSMHGKIIEENGDLYYLDLNSTNGSTVDGRPIKKIKLIPGLVITIGATKLEIASEFDIKKSETNLSEWREALFNYVKSLEMPQEASKIVPFQKCVYVRIKSGLQSGTEWVLGYGPRNIGLDASDLCILDENLDDTMLKISQEAEGVRIEAESGRSFFVKDKKKNTEILKDRLSIQLGNTLLEFGFIE